MLYQWTYLTLYLVFSAISEAATDYPFSIFNFFPNLCYLYSFMYSCVQLYVFNSNTTGVTSGACTATQSRAPEFITSFTLGSCCSFFSFLCSAL